MDKIEKTIDEYSPIEDSLFLAIVCVFFGIFGIHRFMLGQYGTGFLMLVMTLTGFGAIISYFWSWVDLFVMAYKAFKDRMAN